MTVKVIEEPGWNVVSIAIDSVFPAIVFGEISGEVNCTFRSYDSRQEPVINKLNKLEWCLTLPFNLILNLKFSYSVTDVVAQLP